jgi:hypothetical protein
LGKLRHLGYLPGGKTEYLSSLRRFLDFVKQGNPKREEFEKYISESFERVGSLEHGNERSQGIIKDCIYTLKNLRLITEEKNRFELTTLGERFSDSQFASLVYKALDDAYERISDIIGLLFEKSLLSSDEIIESLKKDNSSWETKAQYRVRLNWLMSLGYVVQKGPLYEIVDEGPKTVMGGFKDKSTPSHKELQDALVATGNNLRWRSVPEYQMENYKLDVVWFQENEDIPFFAAEIQLEERDLEKALTRLAYAKNKHIQDFCLYTQEELIPKARRIATKAYPDLARVLKVEPWSKINKERISSEAFMSDIGSKFSGRPSIRFRKGVSGERKR